jgi:hypothetical protein
MHVKPPLPGIDASPQSAAQGHPHCAHATKPPHNLLSYGSASDLHCFLVRYRRNILYTCKVGCVYFVVVLECYSGLQLVY